MDYEQKYKDLVEKLKKAASDPDWEDERFCCVINEHFSELKEYEDEMIRKELIKETKGSEERLFETITNEEFIAWLEKQGKQKSAWSVVDEKMIDEIIDFFENGTVKLQHDLSLYASWLKSIKQRIGG